MGSEYRDRILAALIVIVPFFILWEDTDQGQIYGLYLGAFVYLAMGILRLNRLLGLFLLLVAGWFGFWVSSYFVHRVDLSAVLAGIDAILFMTCAAIIYQGVVESHLEDETFINGICVFALLQAVLAITQFYFFDPVGSVLKEMVDISYGQGSANTPAGTFSNTNYAGAALGICLPLFFFRERRWLLGAAVVLYALILTQCRAAAFAVIVVGAFMVYRAYFFKRTLYRIYGAAFSAVVVAASYFLVAIRPGSLVERYNEFWKIPLKIWLGSWHTFIFGVGPGITARANNYLHNEPLVWVWNFGLLGAVIIMAFIGTTLWKLSRVAGAAMLTCSIVIAVIDMQANHLLHIPVTGLLMVIIMALAQRKINSVLPPKTLMARSI